MTAVSHMPEIHDCSVEGCAFNSDEHCHAGAITISGDHAHCGTFVSIDTRPTNNHTATVGACHRIDCAHNDHLACGADEVSVGAGADNADCLTFSPR